MNKHFNLICYIFQSEYVISEEIRPYKRKYKQVVGWNEYVRDIHSYAHLCYKEWRNVGSPCNGYEYNLMHKSNLIFKEDLNYSKINEKQLINDKIVESYLNKDTKRFVIKSTNLTVINLFLLVVLKVK